VGLVVVILCLSCECYLALGRQKLDTCQVGGRLFELCTVYRYFELFLFFLLAPIHITYRLVYYIC